MRTLALAAAMSICCASASADPVRAPASARTDARTEIQIGLCSPPDVVTRALDLRPRGSPTQVWMFDNPTLTMYDRGLRFRMRIQDGRAELTLKAADQDCAQVPRRYLPRSEAKCEYDVHGTKSAGAVSISRKVDDADALLTGRVPLDRVLSEAQMRFLKERLDIWPLPSDLRALGPIELATYRTADKSYDIDVQRLPRGATYVEISTKVPTADVARARANLERDLAKAGVAQCTDQSAQAIEKLKALLN